MLLKRGLKRHLLSGLFTVLVISMLILSGPAKAVNVNFAASDIDINTDLFKIFTLEVNIDDPTSFFPLAQTVLDFNDDTNSFICTIDNNDNVIGCDFLSVVSKEVIGFEQGGFGYGYGYGYGYGFPGFGYGYGGGISPGVIRYTLAVDVSSFPAEFIGKNVNVDVTVDGGSGSSETISNIGSFNVIGDTDESLVANAKAALTFDMIKGENSNENAIDKNLNLITITEEGVMIAWNSSDATIIDDFDGVVNRPSSDSTDKVVILTAVISKGSVSDTKTFTLTVLKEVKSDTQSVNEASVALTLSSLLGSNSDANNILTDLVLPTMGSNDVEISWNSSNESVISIGGAVSRPSLDTSVTLTATLTKGSVVNSKSFEFIVKGTTDLDLLAANNAKAALTDVLVLNGNAATDQVIGDLNLPTNLAGHEGVVISWATSDSTIITTSGVVTRSATEDKSVTLTATLTKNGKTATKTFDLIVKKKVPVVVVTDESLVANAKAVLTFDMIKGENSNENAIDKNLNLITVTESGVMIAWSSSDTATINNFNGVVKRPSSSSTDKVVTLTAILFKGTTSDTKTFTLTVLKEVKSDTQSVNEANVALTLSSLLGSNSDANNILTDLVLPTIGLNGVKIGWNSSNKNIISTGGAVSRPSLDTSVTLTATLTKGSVVNSKSFVFNVKGTTDLDLLAANNAKAALTDTLVLNGNAATDKVIGNLNLPANLAGHSGVGISWATSDSNIITTSGVVTRSATEDKSVTLTATLTKNGKTATKTFNLIVMKKVPPVVVTHVAEKKVEVKVGQGEIVIDSSNLNNIKKIEIPIEVDEEEEVVINLETLVNNVTKEITLPPTQELVLTRTKSDSTQIVAEIPQGTKIKGTDNWNGLLTVPTVRQKEEISISEGTTETVIEVGFKGGKLTFDKATKLTIPGQAGKRSGYVDENEEFHLIVECTASQIADPDTLPAEGECSTVSGSDMIIWTKHFTTFVTFTPTAEVCDNVDNDLDGSVDEGLTRSLSCGVGECRKTVTQVCASGVFTGTCTPRSPSAEIGDGKDNDCDGQTDEGISATPVPSTPSQTLTTYYYDFDQDGYGENTKQELTAPSDKYTALQAGDCRPSDSSSYPGATESCNGVDNDCDGKPDEQESITQRCYEVANSAFAGIGACSYGYNICTGSSFADECVGDIAPVTESCNGIDDDCDGQTDETFDLDNDGYTSCGTKTDGSDTFTGTFNDTGFDCNENNPNINGGAQEMCNSVDDNCNTIIDDLTIFEPADRQEGVCRGVNQLCVRGEWVEPNYNSVANYESNELTCDGRDNDCDGGVDETHSDFDRDRIADCVDPDVDGDGVLDNTDFVVGNSDDSDSNVPYSLVVAGQEFNDDGVEEGRYLLKLRDNKGKDLAWISYLFSPSNIFDFRNVLLRYFSGSEDEGSALVISGINAPDSVRKAYLLKRLPTSSDMVCIKRSDIRDVNEISDECNRVDEVLIQCNSRSTNGYMCETRVKDGEEVYVVHGMNYYGVKEVDVIPTDFTRDGRVDFDDFFRFADVFGTSVGQPGFVPMFDLDFDNQIDYDDFFRFVDRFGENAGSDVRAKRVSLTQDFLLANVDSSSSCSSLADEGATRVTGTDVGECEYGAEMCRYSTFSGWSEVLSPVGPEDELCDGKDNDCDGSVDEECSNDVSVVNKFTGGASKKTGVKKFYYDGDGDRYGVADNYQTYSFGRYRALETGDCNDNNVNANPSADEICDNVDNDCDGSVDEGNVCGVNVDSDGDGFASILYGGNDCNDNNLAINPRAVEICDNKDNNCNSRTDEGVTITYYLDADDDGFGDVDAVTEACSVPNGYVENDNDCSDNNDNVNPDATEQCNLLDDNCDGQVDGVNICVAPVISVPVVSPPVVAPSSPVQEPSNPAPENNEPTPSPVVVNDPIPPTGGVVSEPVIEEPVTEPVVDEPAEEIPEPAEKPVCHIDGDFDNDGDVDYDDFFKFADYFGTNNATYDLDGDGDVDYDDYFKLADHFGEKC